MFVLKRRDIRGVAANCHIKVLTIFFVVLQGLFILVFYLLLDKTVRNSFIMNCLPK